MAREKIRAAILGYGRSGSTMHADALAGNADDFDVVAVCDIDAGRRKEAAERFGCPTYAEYPKMLSTERPDLVSVITRSDQHAAMTVDCLEAGANVLVTKPWAVNADEARGMVDAADRAGRTLLPWLPARWGADLARLRELLAKDAVGKVFFVRRTVCSFGLRNDWQTRRRHGGGYLLNWGPHIVDPPLLLLGGQAASVFGRLRRVMNPGDAEDTFFAMITLADGRLVQAEYAVAVRGLHGWFVQGDRGTIILDGNRLRLYPYEPKMPDDPTRYQGMKPSDLEPVTEELPGGMSGDPVGIYAEAAHALRGERPFPVTPRDALELSRVLDAIRTSSDEDRVVAM